MIWNKGLLYIEVWNVNWYNHLGEQFDRLWNKLCIHLKQFHFSLKHSREVPAHMFNRSNTAMEVTYIIWGIYLYTNMNICPCVCLCVFKSTGRIHTKLMTVAFWRKLRQCNWRASPILLTYKFDKMISNIKLPVIFCI